jgi:hypothetical protein
MTFQRQVTVRINDVYNLVTNKIINGFTFSPLTLGQLTYIYQRLISGNLELSIMIHSVPIIPLFSTHHCSACRALIYF